MKRSNYVASTVLIVGMSMGCSLIMDFEKAHPGAGGASASGHAGQAGATQPGAQSTDAGAAGVRGGSTPDGGVAGASGSVPWIGGSAGATTLVATAGTSSGGNSTTGGAPSEAGSGAKLSAGAGGLSSTGGADIGGTSMTAAGSSAAGSSATGGMSATGGLTATGGTPATGGIPSTGRPFVPVTASEKSCRDLGSICQGESCCTSIEMPGGTYPMGRSEVSSATDYFPDGSADETPEHLATVASFALDKYEVTVGRFRRFVEDYDAWHVTANPPNPRENAGAHPIAANTGWSAAASALLPADAAALMTSLKNSPYQTWTDAVETTAAEAYPINCVSGYTAFAFCIWDGGRLPTEAEWEYAAAGGVQNRLYPWGSEPPDATRVASTPQTVVGSRLATGGAGYFGHADLSGYMWQWTIDKFDPTYYGTNGAPIDCDNCASRSGNVSAIRGGSGSESPPFRAVYRASAPPSEQYRSANIGIRCARTR